LKFDVENFDFEDLKHEIEIKFDDEMIWTCCWEREAWNWEIWREYYKRNYKRNYKI